MTPVRRECKRCGRNRAEKFFVSSKGQVCATCRKRRVQKNSRNARLRNTYGLTGQECTAILTVQGGGCAICRGTRPRYDVDHNHKLSLPIRQTIRGLLCARCNRQLLPAALDNPEILERAAAYLRNPPAQTILEGPTT